MSHIGKAEGKQEGQFSVAWLSHRIPLAVLMLGVAVVFFLPFRIIGHGYAPMDDSLAISAKVASGKSWNEILAIRPEVNLDRHYQPGWHFLLSVGKTLFSLETEGVLLFSVVLMWSLVALVSLFYFRRPEAFLASFLLFGLLDIDFIYRLLVGRAFGFTMFALISFWALWTQVVEGRRLRVTLAAIGLLAAGATWVHGAWYLLALPVGATLLSGNWRASARFGGAVAIGVFVGALITLHPFEHLWHQAHNLLGVIFKSDSLQNPVGEFHPNPVGVPLVLFFSVHMLMRLFIRNWKGVSLTHPAFLLGLACWVLGLKVARFWYDWGMPSMVFWYALELQKVLEIRVNYTAWRRLVFSLLLCVAFFTALGHNQNNRWSVNTTLDYAYLKKSNAYQNWLPGENGLVYANTMGVFFNFSHLFPQKSWRYVLGLESAHMYPEDVQVYRAYRMNKDLRALRPWADKLRPQDRLILFSRSGKPPPLPQLEWQFLPPQCWIGKPLERPN